MIVTLYPQLSPSYFFHDHHALSPVISAKNLKVPSYRMPTGIYISIEIDSRRHWKSTFKVLSSKESVAWGDTVTLSLHASTAGEVIATLETSWDELLDHGDEPFDLSFPPVHDVHPSLMLKTTFVHACEGQDSALFDRTSDWHCITRLKDSHSASCGHQSPSAPNTDTAVPDASSQPLDYTTYSDSKSKKKDKREKLVNETFIVVQPLPSKSNHLLNLQVQLVPPQSHHDQSHATVQALDQSAQDTADTTSDSTDLQRTDSGQSVFSAYTSASSVSSFALTSTTNSGCHMIIPLYNLQAHNIMTNVIVDAGTDTKVARFAKRGLEILGLAILKPIKVWGTVLLPGALLPSSSMHTSIDDSKQELGLFPQPHTHSSTSRPTTPKVFTTTLSPSPTEIIHKPSFTLTPATPEDTITT
ncbi:uncharacterized protein BJ212DRAFT_1483037 [Suillus subaureus]|uniref:Uncharacterized protein n=1 Tax=Suillus subaureus TaxID=48587 RepID=A0A9P7E6K9_9AGAM|nr:uncharacterized protein BJ212DRAFT_1483037 [Suillus subaureus]KAG1812398.1 hypothetical protein BJ212DRAFT_1483037 [Suillus subaureus]